MEQDAKPEDIIEGNSRSQGEASLQDQNISNQNHDVKEVTEENAEDSYDLEEGKDDHQSPTDDKTEEDEQKDTKDIEQSKVIPEEGKVQNQVLKDSGKEESSRVEDTSPSPSAQPSKPGANVNDSWGIFQEGWLDILGNGELRKKILVPGKGHTTRPQQDQLVTLRTKGWLEDGTEIDFHDSITICLGDGDVVQAWDLVAVLMELGEKAVVTAAPRFAYGAEGRKPDVPPNSLVRYELELLEINDAPDVKDMSTEERCQTADQKREQGNKCFARGDFANAISSYRRALSFIEELQPTGSKEDKVRINEMKVKCYNNLAAAQLKVEAYDAALKTCNTALTLDPNSVKALFRKGKVLANQLNLKDAIVTMKKALLLEPSNKIIHQELSKVSAKLNKEKQDEKQLYEKMVGDMAKIKDVPDLPDEPVKSGRISFWVVVGSASLIAISAILIGVLIMK